MNKECNFVTIDGFSINAIHTTSEGKALVLWLHGITESKDEYCGFFRDGATFLAESGIDSLRIDFRGHGKSSGSSLDFSITGQMLDVKAAVNYIVKFYRQKIKTVIVGCSFGSPPALFAAQEYPQIVYKILLLAPVLSYRKTFINPQTEWAESIFNQKTFSKLERTNQLFINPNFPISARLVEEMKVIKPECALRTIEKEVVIVHGDADSMVPFQVSRELAQTSSNLKLVPFSGMDHGFIDSDDELGSSEKSVANKRRIFELIKDSTL